MRGTGRPIWEGLAGPRDIAALDPGPDAFDPSPDVLVVGGGAIGLAVAAMCTRAGLSVFLVERGRLAGRASGRAAGGLCPAAHTELGPTWLRLARRSLRLHRRLGAEWDHGWRALPLAVLPDEVVPDQGHVDPLRMCASLARRAGRVATHVNVDGIELADDLVTVVRTTRGEVRPGLVVFATGVAPAHMSVASQTHVKGHLIATEPAPGCVDGLVSSAADDLLVLQLPTGQVVAGGTKEPGVGDEGVDPGVVAKIAGAIARLWPALDGVAVTHSWTCFRPLAPGGLPVVGRLPGIGNAWFAVGFYSTGILMAPVVGEVFAEAFVAGDDPAETFWSPRP